MTPPFVIVYRSGDSITSLLETKTKASRGSKKVKNGVVGMFFSGVWDARQFRSLRTQLCENRELPPFKMLPLNSNLDELQMSLVILTVHLKRANTAQGLRLAHRCGNVKHGEVKIDRTRPRNQRRSRFENVPATSG